MTQRWLDGGDIRFIKLDGMCIGQLRKKRNSADEFLQEGVQMGGYHAWVAQQLDQRARISVALDGSSVCGDAMTYCCSVLEDGDKWPERAMWLPLKVLGLQP